MAIAGHSIIWLLDQWKNSAMSLDIELKSPRRVRFFWHGLTHNLGAMAREAGLYEAMWRPCEMLRADGLVCLTPCGRDITSALEKGVAALRSDPDKYKAFNPPNGWGTYEGLLECAEKYLVACKKWPDAMVVVGR